MRTKTLAATAKPEDKPEYKVGDKVRLVSKRPAGWNFAGKMDSYLGKEVIITGIDTSFSFFWFDGSSGWVFSLRDIECKVDAPEDKPEIQTKYKVGDRVKGKHGPGTVICYSKNGFCGVEFDDSHTFGHDCGGIPLVFGQTGASGRCWWQSEGQLSSLDEQPKGQDNPVREVKRAAKVGEKIKIINPKGNGVDYRLNDTLVVTDEYSSGDVFANAPNGTNVGVHGVEYVVLEGGADS